MNSEAARTHSSAAGSGFPRGQARRASRQWPLDVLGAAAAAIALLALYLRTLLPGVGSADTAELQLVAATRGVAHPPGYPTWTLLASTLVDLVPWGTAAWRTSLFSALATAAAAAMAFAALRGLGCRRSVALALAVWLGVLPSVWRLSTVAEVYALNLFFVAAIVACLAAASASLARAGPARPAIVALEGPSQHLLLGAIAALALALGNHPAVLTLAPAILLAVLLARRRLLLRPSFLLATVALAVAGAAQYVTLGLRTFDPTVAYLGVDAGTASRMWEVIGANRHSVLHFGAFELLTERLPQVLVHLGRELGALVPLAILGAVRLPARSSLPLVAAVAADIALVTAYDIPDNEGYYFPALLIAIVLAGVGCEAALRWVERGRSTPIGWALLSAPLLLGVVGFGDADRSRERPTAALAALAALERPALLISLDYDASMTFLYSTELERGEQRGEVRARHLPPAALRLEFGLDGVRRYLEQDLALRWPPNGSLVPRGLPFYVYAPRAEWSGRLEQLGLRVDPVGNGMVRLARGVAAAGRSPLPRALLVGRLEHSDLLPDAIARLASPEFDPAATVLRLGNDEPVGDPEPIGSVQLLAYEDASVTVDVEAERDGWLLLTDTYSSRWEATVDGRPVPFLELDLIYWGVPVDAGRHRVEVRFLPHPFGLRRWLGLAR